MSEHTATPWELIQSTEHHGPYIVASYGGTVADFYAMSNPGAFSVRNGGDSKPILFPDADENAAFVVRAVNSHGDLVAALEELVHQVRVSGAIDDHGHALKNLKALADADAALSRARGNAA